MSRWVSAFSRYQNFENRFGRNFSRSIWKIFWKKSENFWDQKFSKSWISIENFRKSKKSKIFENLDFSKIFNWNPTLSKFSDLKNFQKIFKIFLKSILKFFYRNDFQNFGTWKKLRISSFKKVYGLHGFEIAKHDI